MFATIVVHKSVLACGAHLQLSQRVASSVYACITSYFHQGVAHLTWYKSEDFILLTFRAMQESVPPAIIETLVPIIECPCDDV